MGWGINGGGSGCVQISNVCSKSLLLRCIGMNAFIFLYILVNSKIDPLDKDPHETVKSLSLTYSFPAEKPSLTVEMHSNAVQSEPLTGLELLVTALA